MPAKICLGLYNFKNLYTILYYLINNTNFKCWKSIKIVFSEKCVQHRIYRYVYFSHLKLISQLCQLCIRYIALLKMAIQILATLFKTFFIANYLVVLKFTQIVCQATSHLLEKLVLVLDIQHLEIAELMSNEEIQVTYLKLMSWLQISFTTPNSILFHHHRMISTIL
ncbi:unnamed protein product [Paramecium octaurelia]|uniref:Uncharacterized protein n=1 Tax=Paramecium octaurelia TaxID=43137 RepID=A0A8S1YAE9_PAROT|nr:unnamed protein product [Paramecium octaurelia]